MIDDEKRGLDLSKYSVIADNNKLNMTENSRLPVPGSAISRPRSRPMFPRPSTTK